MEPQIRFCTSADGTRIAYSAIGQGSALIFVPGWVGNLELQLKHPEARKFYLRISQDRMLVFFEGRGSGFSQRDVHDLSLDAHVADIDAIADQLKLERFDLWGGLMGAAISIVYAARHPDRVSRLVLWGAFSHGEEIIGKDAMQGLVALTRSNWRLARRTIADLAFPTGPVELRQWFSDLQRQTISPEMLARYLELQVSLDIRPHLPQVKAPTLLLHRHGDCGVPIAAGRAAAALIPDARFLTLDGDISHPCFGDSSYMEQALQFLEGRSEAEAAPIDLSPAAADEKADPMIDRTISHYRISEKLGEGGMGVVYKAEDTKLRRTIALKFFTPQMLGTEEDKTRFIREAQAAAALDHPNICTVHEIDEFEGQTFIAMAHIGGQGLDEKLKSGPLDVNEAIDLGIQIAEGLQEAHEKGIIHRDIKAANIMITKRGHARIMDFGLAKLSGQSRLTKTATIMGTVAYMSPEQAHGKSAIDHRTDIWSLGVVLYEMLTGTQPFTAPTDAGFIYKIVHEEPEPIEAVRTGVPEALAQAIKKMMQKEPEERYADMEALISDLKAIRAGAAPKIVVEEKTTPSIAVLPFADMSPQKDQEYFCDGISESLINALTQIKDLRVIARTSAFSFKGQNLDVREIGKKLNVGTVLEGSIQKAGDRVRVTAQLINTARGEHLWSEKYDRDMEDIFAIQDEITQAIVEKLKPRLLGEKKAKVSKRQTVDMEAYNLYLRGRYFYNKQTEDGIKKAIEYFEQTTRKDPKCALGYAGLSDCHTILPLYGLSLPKEAFPKAKETALKALEIDNTLAEAHASLGWTKMFYDWDWEDAEEGFRRAIKLNPGYASAHQRYALYLALMDRYDEAIEEVNRAIEVDPLSVGIHRECGQVLLYARRYDEAIEMLEKTLEMDSSIVGAHTLLGTAYMQKSMYQEAIEELESEKKISKALNAIAEANIGFIHALMGKKDKAHKILDDLLERSKKMFVFPTFIAPLFFALDDKDKGFEWLDIAYQEHDYWLCWLKVHPIFFDMHSDPRCHAMLRKIGLEKSDTPLPVAEKSPSIAVLPFVNISADPEQDYFCDGLSEELINALTQIKDLKVIARTSAFSFRGKEVDIRDIGKKLDVGNVLEGSVRKAGNRIRITAQLVDTSSGHHLWSEKYDRNLEDIFAIQDDITVAIVDKLKPKLLGTGQAKLATRQTVDLEAYNLYLKGRWFFNKQSGHDLTKAIECFEQALEKAPDYAQAYAGIADSYVMLPFVHSFAPREAYPKAKEAALKAMEIDDTAAEAHSSLAIVLHVYEYDWGSSEKEFKRALELNPGYAMAHDRYGLLLVRMGRFDEAVAEMKRALELDPLSLHIHRDAGLLLCLARKPDQAIDIGRRLLELDPHYSGAHALLGYAYLHSSIYEKAIEEFRKEKEGPGGFDPAIDAGLGVIDASTGNINEAKQVLERLIERSKREYVAPWWIAWLSFVVEGLDQGFHWLEKGYEEHDNWLCHLKVNPLFDLLDLRSDSRYIALLKKMNLEP